MAEVGAKRINVVAAQVSFVHKSVGFRRLRKRKKGAPGKVGARAAAGAVSIDDLLAAKKAVAALGGTEQALEAIQALRKLDGYGARRRSSDDPGDWQLRNHGLLVGRPNKARRAASASGGIAANCSASVRTSGATSGVVSVLRAPTTSDFTSDPSATLAFPDEYCESSIPAGGTFCFAFSGE